jgi:hypothetical protein
MNFKKVQPTIMGVDSSEDRIFETKKLLEN